MIKPKEKEVQPGLANASFHKPSVSSAGPARSSPIPSSIVSMMYSQSERCGLAEESKRRVASTFRNGPIEVSTRKKRGELKTKVG